LGHEVLLLNRNYEPLNVCTVRRAMSLVLTGKVDIVHENGIFMHTISTTYRAPSVIILKNLVRRPRPVLRLSRRGILARDNFTCQYCGHKAHDMTVDHIIPKRLNGADSWENLVCCCKKCNSRKGGKTIEQAGLRLNRTPAKPHYVPFISITKLAAYNKNEVWKDYLPYVPELDFHVQHSEHRELVGV
jgi:5-methylcytosine-specific restriction endonuclease McrA